MARPCVHQLAAASERIASPVSLFRFVAEDMGERILGKLAREMRLVTRPIAESAETVNRGSDN
jgi:hypothetical protein